MSRIEDSLRLMLVSDGRGDADRLARIAAAAFEGGATTLQIREPAWDRDTIAHLVERLRPMVRRWGARLLVNGLAVPGADGVHLPSRYLGSAAADVAAGGLSGFAVHDPDELAAAARQGADYAVLAPVLPTPCKPDKAPIGLETARAWTRATALPVLWLGGITVETAPDLRREPCVGVAVRSAICEAADPRATTAAIRAALGV